MAIFGKIDNEYARAHVTWKTWVQNQLRTSIFSIVVNVLTIRLSDSNKFISK